MLAGIGSWAAVSALSEIDRMTLYYACRQREGFTIDWATGDMSPPRRG